MGSWTVNSLLACLHPLAARAPAASRRPCRLSRQQRIRDLEREIGRWPVIAPRPPRRARPPLRPRSPVPVDPLLRGRGRCGRWAAAWQPAIMRPTPRVPTSTGHRRLHSACGHVPPAEHEAAHCHRLGQQSLPEVDSPGPRNPGAASRLGAMACDASVQGTRRARGGVEPMNGPTGRSRRRAVGCSSRPTAAAPPTRRHRRLLMMLRWTSSVPSMMRNTRASR